MIGGISKDVKVPRLVDGSGVPFRLAIIRAALVIMVLVLAATGAVAAQDGSSAGGQDAASGTRDGIGTCPTGGSDASSGSSSKPTACGSSRLDVAVTPAQAGWAAVLLSGLLFIARPSLFVVLFTRLRGDSLLDNATRARILALVQTDPGVNYNRIVQHIGKGHGAVEHHLRVLESGKHVVRRRLGGLVCYFPGTPQQHELAFAYARSPGARAILREVEKVGALTTQQAATASGLAPSTVAYHRDRLVEHGLLSQEGTGRGASLRMTALGSSLNGRVSEVA